MFARGRGSPPAAAALTRYQLLPLSSRGLLLGEILKLGSCKCRDRDVSVGHALAGEPWTRACCLCSLSGEVVLPGKAVYTKHKAIEAGVNFFSLRSDCFCLTVQET